MWTTDDLNTVRDTFSLHRRASNVPLLLRILKGMSILEVQLDETNRVMMEEERRDLVCGRKMQTSF